MRPRSRPKFEGLFHDETATDSYWIREQAVLRLPPLSGLHQLRVVGTVLPADPVVPASHGELGLAARLGSGPVKTVQTLPVGDFELTLALPEGDPAEAPELALELQGVGGSNFLAWLGRVLPLPFLQPWRRQPRNRRLRIRRVEADAEVLFDFANRASPWNTRIARRHLRVGLNVAGFLRADLGIGESARCMVRAADAAGLPCSLIDLRLPCKNPAGDDTFAARLGTGHPHPVTVFHLDAPAARDIDHHHGTGFRAGKYNVGYWAWELPDFPDAWVPHADYFDEIWCPSNFTANAVAEKLSVPVLTMPHAIGFARPEGDARARFGLPADQFLFLFLYDLNSYTERKNPAAVLEAFRASGLAGRGAALVIKVHNSAGNPADFAALRAACADLPGTVLIDRTLERREVYALEQACDCFVSLHRSEGFGLALAECMHLGKPVIATDWSASTEFLNSRNGCPVACRTVELDRNHGPYAKGQVWADPDIAHAADWMRRLFADRTLGQRLGAEAQRTIAERFSPAVIGARYRRRLETIASW